MDYYTNLRNQIENTIDKAQAFDILNSRAIEAHNYCTRHIQVEAWGRNVWIAILEDAIRMRAELEKRRIKL